MTMEILLSIIGTLLLILLSALAWALRTLHSDLRALAEKLEAVAQELRKELTDVSDMAITHDATLYGPKGNNGLSLDVRNLKELMARRRTQ